MPTTLNAGVIYEVNNLIPLHDSNSCYTENAMVVPDNDKFVKVNCTKGVFAFDREEHESELHLACGLDGTQLYVHSYYSDFIRGRGADGNIQYFTCEEAARANDFDFSVRLGRWHDKKCSAFYGDETLLSYHDSRVRGNDDKLIKFVDDNDEFRVGIEVEKVDSRYQRDKLAFEILHETGWKKESDGSLNSGGYELVSPVLPLLDVNRIEKACAPVMKYINAHSDSSCGGHINLSKRGSDSRTLLKGMRGFAPLLYALYESRLENRYCKARKWNNYFRYPEKYSAFYLKNDEIVEIRLFSRITNYSVMIWRIKLLQTLFGDFGRNLNQFVLKMSSPENKLYQLLAEQYSREKIKEKIKLVDILSERYGCGKISKSVRLKVNARFGEIVLPIN